MKKIILIFISIPIITLTAQANSFYERILVLKDQEKGELNTQQYQNKIVSVYKKRTVRSSALDFKKFFYANRAAINGNPKAQFDVAIMYAMGKGVQKNERMAFNWFHKSARNNNALAKHYMGLSFFEGRGVRKQMHLAKYWFKLASKQGYRKSHGYLVQVERILAKKYQ